MSKINQLESLRVLKTVIEFGSFTGAAKQLNLSVARVSKSIDRLELELQTKLFVRNTRHMLPTDSGNRCYQYAIKMLEQWESLSDGLSQTQSKPQGNIKISIPMSWGLSVFSAISAQFMVKYPEITVDVNMTDQWVNVIEGEYDLVLRLASKLEDSSLLCKRLKSYKFIACASPEYLIRNSEPSSPLELNNHNCLVFSQLGNNAVWGFSKNNKRSDVRVNAHLKSNNSLLFKDALLSHLGIAYIPDFIVEKEISSGKLTPILTDYVTNELNLYALRPVSQLTPKRLSLFNQFISSALSQ